jgi:hypothetical protein
VNANQRRNLLTFKYKQRIKIDTLEQVEQWKKYLEREKLHLVTEQKMLGGQFDDWMNG